MSRKGQGCSTCVKTAKVSQGLTIPHCPLKYRGWRQWMERDYSEAAVCGTTTREDNQKLPETQSDYTY